jgi:hypothetical protein
MPLKIFQQNLPRPRQPARIPNTRIKPAQRPSIRQPANQNIGTPLAPPRRGFRNHRHAYSVPDHPAHRVKAAQPHAQLKPLACLNRVLPQMLL